MKYTVSINSKVSHIVDAFDDLILKNDCRFDWLPLSSLRSNLQSKATAGKFGRACKKSLMDLVTPNLKRSICFNGRTWIER
jgi:hypothetical protein